MHRQNSPISRQIARSTESDDMGIATLAQFSRAMIKREKAQAGITAEEAIRRIARRFKTTADTIDGIIRQRSKRICMELRSRIITAALSDVQQQIEQLEHEQRLLEAMGFSPSYHDYCLAQAAIEEARSALARMRAPQ